MSSKHHSRWVLLAVTALLLCSAAVPARADSAYNISGYFYNNKGAELYFGGVVDWNATTHQVSGYTLTLGGSTFTCSGMICGFVSQTFKGPGYREWLVGSLDPKDTEFRLFGEGKGHFHGKLKDVAWIQSMPDAPAMAELLCVLMLLGLMIPGARVLRRQN